MILYKVDLEKNLCEDSAVDKERKLEYLAHNDRYSVLQACGHQSLNGFPMKGPGSNTQSQGMEPGLQRTLQFLLPETYAHQ